MKKNIVFICTFAALVLTTGAFAQRFNELDISPMDMAAFPPATDTTSEVVVRVIYSRPQLKGRPLSELVPAGKVWRTGANESTEISFYKDVMMGGKNIPAGSYSLFTIPGEKNWTIILNKDLHNMGSHSYDESADMVRMTVPSSSGEQALEAFSIGFERVEDGVHMVLAWDKTRVTAPIQMEM